MNDLENKGWS